jgi:choline dehydrogenase-like flavoprotein
LVSGALVRRIVIRDGAAVGVEYERRGRCYTVTARHEIVLSAGAYGTPQLLQVSGVGPAEHLRSVGIVPVVDSPQVGHNLTDHPATFMNWELAPGFIGRFGRRPQSEMFAALVVSSFRETDQQPDGGGRTRSFGAGFGRAGLPADPCTDICPAGRDQLSTAGVVDLAVILDASEPRQCAG